MCSCKELQGGCKELQGGSTRLHQAPPGSSRLHPAPPGCPASPGSTPLQNRGAGERRREGKRPRAAPAALLPSGRQESPGGAGWSREEPGGAIAGHRSETVLASQGIAAMASQGIAAMPGH